MTSYNLIRPLLFRLDPETAHNLPLRLLKTGLAPKTPFLDHPALKCTLWNLSFPNPVGLAAGFDKNAEVIREMLAFGFGFVEVGTVTPKPQHGNPLPRIFRDPVHEAVINRMGFPGGGLARFKENLQKFINRKPRPAGIIGLNIGMNKAQTDPAKDYCFLVDQLAPLADYLTINISSPNTPGLRNLQEPEHLKALLDDIMRVRTRACATNPPPLLLKLAPDLSEDQQQTIAKTILECGVDGLILTNTTLDRPAHLPPEFAQQQGGLSGSPVKDKSTDTIRNFYRFTNGKIPIIGLGGISTGADAYEKIKAGASLVQIYTALVFKGPAVVNKINNDILEYLQKDGYSHIGEAVGADFRNAGANQKSENR